LIHLTYHPKPDEVPQKEFDMPRRKGKGFRLPDQGAATGIPAVLPFVKKGLTRGGGAGSAGTTPLVKVSNADGSIVTTFPSYEPLFGNRNKIIQVEYSGFNTNSFTNSAVIASPWETALQSSQGIIYTRLLDNIVMKYADVQNLALSSYNDFASFKNQYAVALASYLPLIAILNGDGFNERVSQLAQVGTSWRTRIQSGYDRLQTIPIAPGLIDTVSRMVGLFATYQGGPCILANFNSTAGVSPIDLTLSASWNTLVNNAETALSLLLTQAEAGIIRTVLSEYYGAPTPLPYPGVRLDDGLFHAHRLKSWLNLNGATNGFSVPYLLNGATAWPATGGQVPVLIPRGHETEIWWTTLFKPGAFGAFNNVAKASCINVGFMTENTQTSSIRYYVQNQVTSNTSSATATLNGFSDPMNEFYWAPPVANSDTIGYGSDARDQNEFTMVTVTMDHIASQTIHYDQMVWIGKQRIPFNMAEYNVSRVRQR
jgi:hypothetical protein